MNTLNCVDLWVWLCMSIYVLMGVAMHVYNTCVVIVTCDLGHVYCAHTHTYSKYKHKEHTNDLLHSHETQTVF